MLAFLPLLVFSTLPLFSFVGSSVISTVIILNMGMVVRFAFLFHTFLYLYIVLYGSYICVILINQYLKSGTKASVLKVHLGIFQAASFLSLALNAFNLVALFCIGNRLFSALPVVLGVIDCLYLKCAKDVKKEMFPRLEIEEDFANKH